MREMNLGPAGFVNAAAGMVHAAMKGLATANSGRFVVNEDNILAAGKIIQAQIDALKDRLDDSKGDLRVVPPGSDRVSGLVAEEWNKRLIDDEGSYAVRVDSYIVGLENLVTQLRESALGYGYNEEEITAALGAKSA
ncbi:hypothetical protein ACFPM7_01170 [Actinokineospora guangxiensis]|uniref:PE domain-containing protein n=1 Tax=Actinokineospora guangxiensis TaxID=1490288 RepID=A0ABW0EIA2_9PSEU